jgi:dolichyldiphosphatase
MLKKRTCLEIVNESVKWVVSSAVGLVIMYRRDITSAYWLVGSILAAAICRFLKFVINEARPSDRLSDPGMPSSHANSLAFLSTFVALWCYSVHVDPFDSSSSASFLAAPIEVLALCLAAPLVGACLASLRVALGFHTAAQVAVGWALGALLAIAWWRAGQWHLLEAVAGSAFYSSLLWGVTAAAALVFALANADRWKSELRRSKTHINAQL